MKAILIEPLLVVVVSLFWIIVLPFAAIFCSGLAISEKVAACKTRLAGNDWLQPAGFQPEPRPSNPS